MFRDFVGGACDGGNDLAKFANGFDQVSRVEFDAGRWDDSRQYGRGPPPHQEVFNPEAFLNPDLESWHDEFNEFAEFDHLFEGGARPGMPPQAIARRPPPRDAHFAHMFQDFLRSSVEGVPMARLPPNLSFEDKSKIRDRATHEARNICRDPRERHFIEDQLQHFFDMLGIREDARAAISGHGPEQWFNEYQKFEYRPPRQNFRSFDRIWQEQEMNRVWEQQRGPPQLRHVEAWVDDYSANWKSYDPKLRDDEFKQFEKVYEEVSSERDDWVEEYKEKEMDEREEEDQWFSQFLPGGKFESRADSWVSEYTGRPTGNWVEEFQGHSVGSRSANWVNEFNGGKPDGDQWASEFNNDNRDEITQLTRQISQINHPKLQNSQFMQFINNVSSGSVNLQELRARADSETA